MVTEDDVRSRVDHAVRLLDLVLARPRIELDSPVDDHDDQVRARLGPRIARSARRKSCPTAVPTPSPPETW